MNPLQSQSYPTPHSWSSLQSKEASGKKKSSEKGDPIFSFIIETENKNWIYLGGGIALLPFQWRLSVPLISSFVFSFLTRMVIKGIESRSNCDLTSLKSRAHTFHKETIKIEIITMIFITAISYYVPLAGLVVGAILGIYDGLYHESQQAIKENEQTRNE